MAEVTVPTPPPLATVRGVELMHAGQWNAMSGEETFTLDDLAAAVAALDCPAVRRPILKFGHDGNHGKGLPALGYVDNLATTNGGRTLAGDYVGMPAWLAGINDDGQSVLTSAYPDRSIEGEYDYRCQIGHIHPFVVHAISLLGEERPAIGTLPSLQDLAALYGVAASVPDQTGRQVTVTVRAATAAADATDNAEPVHTGAMIALVPSEADAERLAVKGGEPADELHATMFYLGEGADFSDDSQAHLIELLRGYFDGEPPVEADGFAINVFNPTSDETETAIVLGVGGQPIEAAHARVLSAIEDYGADLPEQHAPWVPHITLAYSDDLTLVEQLVDRTGPVTFDRLRVAFADDVTDIPLATTVNATARSSPMPNPRPTEVAAGVTTEDVRRAYYDDAPWSVWICEMQLDPELQLIITDDNTGSYSRVPVMISGDEVTFGDPIKVQVTYVDVPAKQPAAGADPHGPLVFASRAESRPQAKAVAKHTTDTTDGAWDGPANVKRIPADATASTMRKVYAWVDPDGDADTKAAYKLPHHEVSADGVPGAASIAGCRAAIAALNGARGGTDIPDADRQATYNHLAKHLRDADVEPPELVDTAAAAAAKKPAPAATSGTQTPAAEPEIPPTQEDDMPLSDIRSRLGLPDDADEQAILAALDDVVDKATAPPADPAPTEQPQAAPEPQPVAASLPDGVVTIEKTVLDELRRNAQAGAEARARQVTEDRDREIQAAVSAGKIRLDRVKHWTKAWEADPEGTKSTLASLETGLHVPVAAVGYTGGEADTSNASTVTEAEADGWAGHFGIPAKELLHG